MRKTVFVLAALSSLFFGNAMDLAAKPATREATGKRLYEANECSACHLIGSQGCKEGVRLDALPKTHDRKYITEQLQDPEAHVKRRGAPSVADPSLMPNPRLGKEEIALIVDYILSIQPTGKDKLETSKDSESSKR